MRALILAAGMATRLQVLLKHEKPKCLLDIGSTTILGNQIKALIDSGVEDIVVVLGYMAEEIMKYLTINFPDENFMFVYNPYYDSTNTIYSVYLAGHLMEGSFIQLNADVIADPRLIVDCIKEFDGESLICVSSQKVEEEEVKVELKDEKVIRISKKVEPEKAYGEAIGINIIGEGLVEAYRKELEKEIQKDNKNDYFEKALENLAKSNPISIFDCTKYKVIEVDFPEDYQKAKDLFDNEIK